MKHVFIINSHTTFLTSMGVIAYLGLNDDDVIFIYIRNYKNTITQIPYKTIDATKLALSYIDITSNYDTIIRTTDSFINQEIGTRYNLYVPHFWHYFFQVLYTHPFCRRVSYVQEGGPAYRNLYEKQVSLLERFRMFIWLAVRRKRTFECKWYKRGIIFKQRKLDSFAINNTYFKHLPSENHIVEWPSQKVDIALVRNNPIFIFDGYVTNGIVEKDVYLSLCHEIVSEQASSHNYVKFHPAQTDEERKTILRYFSEIGCMAEIMSDEIPMEFIIIQFKKMKYIGFTSSLLYYAHDYGHEVISYETKLLSSSKLFSEYVRESGFQTYSETYITL